MALSKLTIIIIACAVLLSCTLRESNKVVYVDAFADSEFNDAQVADFLKEKTYSPCGIGLLDKFADNKNYSIKEIKEFISISSREECMNNIEFLQLYSSLSHDLIDSSPSDWVKSSYESSNYNHEAFAYILANPIYESDRKKDIRSKIRSEVELSYVNALDVNKVVGIYTNAGGNVDRFKNLYKGGIYNVGPKIASY